MIDDLEQKVAKLVRERGHVVALDRICHLIGFLDRVRRDAGKVLRTVPRTAVNRIAQIAQDLAQGFYREGRWRGSERHRWLR